jgi:hypothetical protein
MCVSRQRINAGHQACPNALARETNLQNQMTAEGIGNPETTIKDSELRNIYLKYPKILGNILFKYFNLH